MHEHGYLDLSDAELSDLARRISGFLHHPDA
jgi:hypothetical protein